jgi:hypothetical protein
MQRNLSKARRPARSGRVGVVLFVLLVAAAGSAVAQTDALDFRYGSGRMGLGRLLVLQPSIIYRPIDDTSSRPGGDALGMGGAYLASASGTIALGWNPAGLADLEHLSFTFDGYSRGASGSAGGHPDSLVVPSYFTLHLLNYQATRKGGFVPNFVAAAVPLWISGERRLVAAFGWRHYAETLLPEQTVSEMVAGGGGATFPVVLSLDRTEKGGLEAFSPALAFRVGPTLSFGASVNVLDGGVRANRDQRFTIVGMPLRGTVRTTYKYSGLSPEFGARYATHVPNGMPGAWAFRITPGYTLKVRSGTFYELPIVQPGAVAVPATRALADYDLQIPVALAGGVAVHPMPRLLLAADWNRQLWTKTKVKYKTSARDQAPPDSVELPLADVTTWHIGAEYTLLRRSWGTVPVRIGYRTAPQGYLDPDSRDVTGDTLQTDLGPQIMARSTGVYHGQQPKANAYSLGVSLDTSGIRYDLGFESISYEQTKWFFDEPYHVLWNPGWSIVKVTQKVSKVRLSATYSF